MAKVAFMMRLDTRIEDEKRVAELYENMLAGRKHDEMLELLILGYKAKYKDTAPMLFATNDASKPVQVEEPTKLVTEQSADKNPRPAVKGGEFGLAALAGDQLG